MHVLRGVIIAGLVVSGLAVLPSERALGGAQAGLRSSDAALVRDDQRWVSLSGGESLSDQGTKACKPGDAVWQKGFAHVPYRIGPTPDQLADCWTGDAMPGGPGAWADAAAGSVGSPAIARVGSTWRLYYAARVAGSQQRCVGMATSGASTGPFLPGTAAVVCPAGGLSAVDPDLFYDRQTSAWFLLWRQDTDAQRCQTDIHVRAIDTQDDRIILRSSAAALGFDEISGVSACPGGVRHLIESPAMVRAADNQLWLFFSANSKTSTDYATGWALCGTAVATADCGLLSAFDPAGRNRPTWGWSQRAGANAKPYLGFPDLPGFGGMSLATADPTATGPQPVYATGQMYWGGAAQLRTQFVFRLDTSWTVPALFESDIVTIHGKSGAFGGATAATTPSGQSLSTRAVRGWGWPNGHHGIFNAMAGDGTLIVQGGSYNADDFVMGAYDPRSSAWSNIPITSSTGSATISPSPAGKRAGGSAWDAQAIRNGSAVAFTDLFGFPWDHYQEQAIPAEGVWPAFGLLTKVNNTWQVASGSGWKNQWTGGQLARSVPRSPAHPSDPSISERACEPVAFDPAESFCGGPNEVSELPRSKDLIVTQYFGGLMALHVTGPDSAGRYDVRVSGFYKYPRVPDINPPGPAGDLVILPKTAMPDPTSAPGDERFIVGFDIFHAESGATPVPLQKGIVQEFSYDSATGEIKPTSAPINNLGEGIYDYQGNLWGSGPKLTVTVKGTLGGPDCPFSLAQWTADPTFYRTGNDWGQTCQPDYDILQRQDVGGPFGGGMLQLSEDPASHTMVGIDTWNTANTIAIRHTGTGRDKTFTIGNLTDTGRNLLPMAVGSFEQRPGVFDANGRLWFVIHHWPPQDATPYTQPLDHWVIDVDVPRLFEPPPVALPAATGQSAIVQAENNTTMTTTKSTTEIIAVDSDAYLKKAPGGLGFILADNTGFGHLSGTVRYQVYVPEAGTYRIVYQATRLSNTPNAAIQLGVGANTYISPVKTGWQPTDPRDVPLPAGLQTLSLSPPPNGGGWYLDWIQLTRV
ncbi:hypothetical protein J5X84_28645 [Streptosporangiaceae bacterium NEAU-GS5]|nr:hypothetical protein [Streptosporangiaceae bacterium NEAU-GS5]